MEVVLLWFIFAIVVGIAASSRGRIGFGWFLLSLLLSPVIGLILVLVLPDRSPPRDLTGERITVKTHVRCPDCRELVRADASKCKHCGARLVPQQIG